MLTESESIIFILVRPVYLGNIGSVARSMKNFGFQRLRLVDPPRNYKDAEARKMAVGAFDILKSCQVFASVSEALQDVSLAIGTTSGQQRESLPLPFQSVAPMLKQRSPEISAILFGDERNGLSRQDLERCHQVTSIPTSPDFSALNLAQAVAICAYELSRAEPITARMADQFPTGADDDELFDQLGALFDKVEFSRTFNRAQVLSELRSFYQRAQPTTREAALLKGALHSINKRVHSD